MSVKSFRFQNVYAVITMAARKLTSERLLAPRVSGEVGEGVDAEEGAEVLQQDVMPIQMVVLPARAAPVKPCSRKVFSSTGRSRSKLKKPMPHSPTTPEKASSMPTMELRLQRGSVNRSANDPIFFFSARAFSHDSGSFSFLKTTSARGAGSAPTRNSQRQAP